MILTGLIGRPVTHSWSPILFNSLYERKKIDAIYLSIDLPTKNISRFVDFSRESFLGFNITAPHKIDIVPFLDEIDPSARKIGSVNLVRNHERLLSGYNTDYFGFKRTITENRIDFTGKNILIAGTGGIFRTVAYAITESFSPSRIAVLSRRPSVVTGSVPPELRTECFHYITKEALVSVEEYDVVINCTPIGTYPDIDGDPFEGIDLGKNTIGIDMVYNPPETRFLNRIAELGGKPINGLELFISQAMETYRILFEEDVNRTIFENIVEDEITGGK